MHRLVMRLSAEEHRPSDHAQSHRAQDRPTCHQSSMPAAQRRAFCKVQRKKAGAAALRAYQSSGDRHPSPLEARAHTLDRLCRCHRCQRLGARSPLPRHSARVPPQSSGPRTSLYSAQPQSHQFLMRGQAHRSQQASLFWHLVWMRCRTFELLWWNRHPLHTR